MRIKPKNRPSKTQPLTKPLNQMTWAEIEKALADMAESQCARNEALQSFDFSDTTECTCGKCL